jgi:hypothetical protein
MIESAAPPLDDGPPPAALPVVSLESRVERLEAGVAALQQDAAALEERVAQRVSERLQHQVSTEAERLSAARPAAPLAMMAAAERAFRAVAPAVTPTLTRVPWLVVDLWLEAVAIVRMFFDLKYKVGWTTRILVLVLLPLILVSHWWVPLSQIPFVGELVEKLIDLALAFVMFKALGREARRYQEYRNAIAT